jgi:serine/threonine protein kinase
MIGGMGDRFGLGDFSRDAAVQWEGGTEAQLLEKLRDRITEQKQEVERTRKSLKGPRPIQPENGPPPTQEELDEEIWEQRELCTTKLDSAKHDETEVKERERLLQVERVEHLRQLRAVEAEDQVDQIDRILQEKFQILRLLSKGSSSTVYRAHDLHALQPCLVRVHDLNTSDDGARLEAIGRDCEAMKHLRHPGLLSLLDNFQHEKSSYVTVWEFVEGDSLEAYLLRNGPLTEKEARGIVLQILSALRLIESKGQRLDSQDLRPSRLTLCGGEVKITAISLLCVRDRGVDGRAGSSARQAFVVSDMPPDSGASIEVPEAEDETLGPSLVWMSGIILYEMLFGKRPEARGTTAFSAPPSAVQLPDQPKVSGECREFLARLLDRDLRLTVQEAYNDPFITPARKPR